MSRFHMLPVRLRGCAVGLKNRNGEFSKKPWCLITAVPQRVQASQDKQRVCPEAKHPELFGAEARDSPHYTAGFVVLSHSAMVCRMAGRAFESIEWPTTTQHADTGLEPGSGVGKLPPPQVGGPRWGSAKAAAQAEVDIISPKVWGDIQPRGGSESLALWQ